MKNALTILVISLVGIVVEGNVVNTSDIVCPRACPEIYDPVCGTNGNTYTEFGNECLLRSSNCHLRNAGFNAFIQTDLDWCRAEFVANLRDIYKDIENWKPECIRPCPMIYAPLCVSNGKYRGHVSNNCELETYNCALGLNDTMEMTEEGMSYFRILKIGKC